MTRYMLDTSTVSHLLKKHPLGCTTRHRDPNKRPVHFGNHPG
jgi:hypothetical protein